MITRSLEIGPLRELLLADLLKDFADTSQQWLRHALESILWRSADRFARLAAKFDRITSREGFRLALRDLASSLTDGIVLEGLEHVPAEGPLLILSNHPGTVDSVALGASLNRDDLNIVATGFPFLRNLPHTSRHLIYVDPRAPSNVCAVRAAIDHLRQGGAVLLFPAGRVEPDPAIASAALPTLESWSRSVELFLRRVPETRTVVAIVSGVLYPIFLLNPLFALWKGIRDRAMVAGVSQLAVQFLWRGAFRTRPRISFDTPQTLEDLQSETGGVYAGTIGRARRLMTTHLAGTGLAARA
jgi:hypothetical protein